MHTYHADNTKIFRLFAQGKTPEQAAEILNESESQCPEPEMSLEQIDKLFREYLELPVGEKLRVTLLPLNVSNRLHRLIDDMRDLRRVDALLECVDEKSIVSLLDVKRKIKERMLKEGGPESGMPAEIGEDGMTDEIIAYFEKITGISLSEE